ncbi:glutaredoxin-like protein NrdH [Alkalibacterium kapii]|uniref:Glutaredoxin-like protein NrdH n=1 Tax=Alkalibacterium kapii TaxID=426704 RepID=A0A511AV37_9LACT|nr:glutaredoxin-like protein NrdH [Alkalibacterium kapii]GEK92016.1 NrdH-redoxin [Alkalibacterium kapii]
MDNVSVTVYSKPDCMQCQFTKKYLESKGIPFKEKDVNRDVNAIDEVKKLGFSSLPVVLAEGIEAFNGFRPDMLNRLV